MRGKLPPGTALSEAAISASIQVSRTPVREALAQLADEQLVQIYRQVGTIVAPVRTSLIEEGRFVRSTLECANHVQLALSITPSSWPSSAASSSASAPPSPAGRPTSSPSSTS